jgi:hypothetical protein
MRGCVQGILSPAISSGRRKNRIVEASKKAPAKSILASLLTLLVSSGRTPVCFGTRRYVDRIASSVRGHCPRKDLVVIRWFDVIDQIYLRCKSTYHLHPIVSAR